MSNIKHLSQNKSKRILSFALTLKKISFLFLLKYKAESMLAGILVKRLGKPWSSLKPVYLHTLSSVTEHAGREERYSLNAERVKEHFF